VGGFGRGVLVMYILWMTILWIYLYRRSQFYGRPWQAAKFLLLGGAVVYTVTIVALLVWPWFF